MLLRTGIQRLVDTSIVQEAAGIRDQHVQLEEQLLVLVFGFNVALLLQLQKVAYEARKLQED
jgi:hypothetical protein